jgi:two-component system, sensor histidine kinase
MNQKRPENRNNGVSPEAASRQPADAAEFDGKTESCTPDNKPDSCGHLLAALGHELRTPLAGVLGMLELALDGELAPEQRRCLELANGSAQALLRLVQDMHDYGRQESGRLITEAQTFEVRPWAEGLRRKLPQPMGRPAVPLHIDLDPSLPEMVQADGERIGNILLNLVEAQHKTRRPTQLFLCLELLHSQQNYLLATLSEKPEQLDDRAKAALLAACGSGTLPPLSQVGTLELKLALSRHLAAALGGTVGEHCSPSEAGFYSVVLPCITAGQKLHPEAGPASRKKVAGTPSAAFRILLVEDDDAIRKLLELLIQHRGMQVTSVADGEQALAQLQHRRYDLVVMDLRMPRLDGLTATRLIREQEQANDSVRLPIIGITAHGGPEDRDLCLQAGMDERLSKPIRSEDLYAAIERLLAWPETPDWA